MRRPRRHRVHRAVVYLKGGNSFAFRAENITVEPESVSWKWLKGSVPLWIDYREVQAITSKPDGHRWRVS